MTIQQRDVPDNPVLITFVAEQARDVGWFRIDSEVDSHANSQIQHSNLQSQDRETSDNIIIIIIIIMKNAVFWDVTPCCSCKNRRFGGT
jgi:hypothetical protein